MCTSSRSLTTPSKASRHCTCTRRESATAAYFGCMELLLPPRPFRAAPSSLGSSSLFYVATRAMVRVRRARQGPAPDSIPYILDKRVYTSTFSSGVGACWWMPAGDCVCPRVLLCAVSRSCTPLYVPPWLGWLRFVQSNGFSGVADGCQLALTVSGLTPHDMVAQVSSRTPSRRQRWTWKFWGSFLLRFRGSYGSVFGFPLPGVSCCGVLCISLFPWECRAVPERSKTARADE